MKFTKTIKLLFFSASILIFLSSCSLTSAFDLSSTSTINPVPSIDSQSTPVQIATIPILPSSTTSIVTLLPTVTTTPEVSETVTPTATATATTPSNAPYALSWVAYSYTCAYSPGGTNMTMDLNWSDPSNNESGFRVYRDNVAIVTLAANTTSYVDVTFIPAGSSASYFIEIYNQDWQVRSSTITYSCN